MPYGRGNHGIILQQNRHAGQKLDEKYTAGLEIKVGVENVG
jgi:hypothetical protein